LFTCVRDDCRQGSSAVSIEVRNAWREAQVARHTVHNLADAARQSGVQDRLLAEAMILHGWMIITGATEGEARQIITSLLTAKLQMTH
jgi:hypothetical protein